MEYLPYHEESLTLQVIRIRDNFFARSDLFSEPTEIAKISENGQMIQFVEPISAGYWALYTYHKRRKKLVIQKSYTSKRDGLSNAITFIFRNCS